MKYYTIRILAALIFMGSIGVGFIAGAEFGKLIGLLIFVFMAAIGIKLHLAADKTRNQENNSNREASPRR